MSHVDLDVYYDVFEHPEEHQNFYHTLAFFSVTYTILEKNGPAGGNPLVRFTGASRHLIIIIQELFATCSNNAEINNDNFKFLVSKIQPQ